MGGDVLEALTVPCGGDGPHEGAVAWCAAWDLWLCGDCRRRRTDAELRPELAEGTKPGRWLPGEPALVLLWPSRSGGMTGRSMTC